MAISPTTMWLKQEPTKRDNAIALEWISNPGESLRKLGERFDLSYEMIRIVLKKTIYNYKVFSPQNNKTLKHERKETTFFHEKLHEYIQNFKCIPDRTEWDAYAKESENIPTSEYLQNRFDSWFNFISPVAICYHDRCLCQSRDAQYSDDDLINILVGIADLLGEAPTYEQVDEMTPSNLYWIDFYERFGRLSDVWDALDIPYQNEDLARGQNFTYSNNDLFKWLCKGYDEMGRNLEKKWFTLKEGAPHENTIKRRLSGCWWSVLCMVDRYGDVDDAQNWDKSKLFMYHFNGKAHIDASSLPDRLADDNFTPKKGGIVFNKRKDCST